MIEPMNEVQARAVGRLASRARDPAFVGLTVVEGALRRLDVIVTSDRGHLQPMATAIRERIPIGSV